MIKYFFSFFAGSLVCYLLLKPYMEERMHEKVLQNYERVEKNHTAIFAPYRANDLVTFSKMLTYLNEGKECIVKQVLALRILTILDVINLKDTFDLSEEKLNEIRVLAEDYEPFKENNSASGCNEVTS